MEAESHDESKIRSGRKDGFTVLYNSMVADKRLSLKAKGLFAVMMSRPEDWEFSVSGLAAFTGCGKDAIRNTLAELEKVGYLIREQDHKDDGTFGGNIYVLQDIAPPSSGKPDNGEAPLSGNTVIGVTRQRETPSSGNPTQPNKDYNTRRTKVPPISPNGDELWMLFDRFWKAYPKKKGKKKARDVWAKLVPDMELCRKMSAALEAQKKSREWTKDNGDFIPYPATWLNGRRWEDEIPSVPIGTAREAEDTDGI